MRKRNMCILAAVMLYAVSTNALLTEYQNSHDKDSFYREFLMPGVSPQQKDAYLCTAMLLNATEEWIVRYEPQASANRAHHMLLYGCSDVNNMNSKGYWDCGHHGICSGSRIIYAWAKNAPSTNLPEDVGFRIGRDFNVKYLVLQIHYAIAMDVTDKDHSGLKMLMTNTRQKYKAGIYLLAKGYLVIPPHTERTFGDLNCVTNFSDDINLFAFRVHAHILGTVITGYRYNGDSDKLEEIAKGNPQWPQSFYPTKEIFAIKKNDILHARCTFNSSQRGRNTLIGATSDDEMCNLYLMYYTDREHGPDSGYCGREQFPELSKNLPPESYQPLPENDKLWKQTFGENGNKDKEISYEKVFESTHTPTVNNTEKVSKLENEFHLERNWGPEGYTLGQVSGVAVDSGGDVVIFHRGDRIWDSISFDGSNLRDTSNPIQEHTLLHLKKDNGTIMHKWGEKFFYMPHGLTIDDKDNIWVTDVGMHQVFKFPPNYGNGKAQIILGKRFEPGNGKNNFCKPTAIAVMENGEFFVSDGYCNSRIVQFSVIGKFIKQIDSSENSEINVSFGKFSIPHSLALIGDNTEICTADREHGRILCFGTQDLVLSRQFHFAEWGQRLFSIAYSKKDGILYAVNGPQFLKETNKIMIFQVNISSNILETSFSPYNEGFNNPHDIAVSSDGKDLYVVEIGPNKIWKFSKVTLNGTIVHADEGSSSTISYIVLTFIAISIIVLCMMMIYFRYHELSVTHYFGFVGKSCLKIIYRKHQFERVPTTDMTLDSDSMDSEIEEFSSNIVK